MNNNYEKGDSNFFQRKTIAMHLKNAASIYFLLTLIGAIILVIYSISELYYSSVIVIAAAIASAIVSYFIAMLIFAAGEAVSCLQRIADAKSDSNSGINSVEEKESELKAIENELPEL